MNQFTIVAALLATAAMPAAAIAAEPQDVQAAQDDGAQNDGVQDIVVTAQRVTSSIQKTPISIQAYSGEDLEKRGVTDVGALARTDSSVNINLSTGQPIIAVRGVASQNATEVGDPAVSVAADGVFNNRPSGMFAGLYDIERIEILRGPQGTLFGRNSTGGTLNIITARADNANEAGFTAEVGNYDLFAVQGFGNVVLSDGLYGRVSYNFRSRKGFRDNAPALKRGDDEEMKSVRFQLAFEPSDSFSAWILGQYTKIGGLGPVSEIIPFVYPSTGGREPLHTLPTNLSDGKTFPLYAQYQRDVQQWDVRGGMTFSLPGGESINYLGGYSSIRHTRQQAINPFNFGATPVPFIYRNIEKPDTINQELRIASAPEARLRWQAGVYYFKEDSSVLAFTQRDPGSTVANKLIQFDYPVIKSSSTAVFAQASYDLTDALTFTAGGRYTWDKKERDGTFSLLFLGVVIPQPASTKADKPTWSVGLDYQITDRNLLYAKVSTGYKVGGFNNADSDYGPETVTSYEIGSKNSFLDNHLQLNLTAFRMDYNDQQVSQFVTGEASTGSITVNAGRSRIWGAELNLIAQSDELGRFNLSGNYTHARYKEFLASAGWNTSINLNLAGNSLPLSPDWSFAAQYERPIEMASGAMVTPSLGLKYQSEQYFAATNYPVQRQGAYAYLDAGLAFEPASKAWSVQAYVRNLTDKTVFADATEFYTFNNYTFTYQPPRTYGVRFSARFD